MEINEAQIDRWLERGGKFFKSVARNPVVRGALRARGLTDEELGRGWQLYSAYSATHAVLDVRYPEVSRFLFENLEANVGVAAVAGVLRFLDRISLLRDGKAPSVDPDQGRSAVDLLATRRIVDTAKEAELRSLIETARLGARPDEVIEPPEMDPRRRTGIRPQPASRSQAKPTDRIRCPLASRTRSSAARAHR